MGTKQAYPWTDAQDKESNLLMAELVVVEKRAEELRKQIRTIIYSGEKPR